MRPETVSLIGWDGHMPSISMFFGIVIYMYRDDHNPPHIHAIYQGEDAVFLIDGGFKEGSMPRRQRTLVEAWIEIHHDELLANWDLAQTSESLYKIDPLR